MDNIKIVVNNCLKHRTRNPRHTIDVLDLGREDYIIKECNCCYESANSLDYEYCVKYKHYFIQGFKIISPHNVKIFAGGHRTWERWENIFDEVWNCVDWDFNGRPIVDLEGESGIVNVKDEPAIYIAYLLGKKTTGRLQIYQPKFHVDQGESDSDNVHLDDENKQEYDDIINEFYAFNS